MPRMRRLPSARLHSTSNRFVVDTSPLSGSSDSWFGCQLKTSRHGRPATCAIVYPVASCAAGLKDVMHPAASAVNTPLLML